MVHIRGLSQIKGHKKWIHVFIEQPDKPYSKSIVTTPGYLYLHEGSSRVTVALKNLTSRSVKLKPKTLVATISAVNKVPPL